MGAPREKEVDDARYAALRRALERAVARTCPSWLASRREDVVQAAMMRIISRHRDGVELDAMGSGYVFKVAYTALVDEIRHQRRRKLDSTSSAEETELHTEAGDPERRTAARQLGAAIKACLALLAQTRNVAVSLYLQGFNVPQISEQLGGSRKQAENAVYRGLADMRRCLTDKGVQP